MRDQHEENFQRLNQIGQAINMISEYTKDESAQSFCSKPMLHDAVLMQFVIIGEAITHIDYELLEKHNYPWYKVKAFRNLIAHEYFNIKLEAVWTIIENEVPALEQIIKIMIELEF
jgi:uncharacterized protein with HEPN domain